ncbi:hypothetical protein BCV69DRAFT_270565 [Microstroma glucosiphilum]|uniref:Uncharacterized protein n=1 Tax=Pseudomicrostroma glucosiphilum TaxID=1684307 RepID=A0A316U8Z1_9BASI|nr:hypothetical protein BCV69DRAFT_270565 [Pseudomicrostroma glucosiphilum]PWN20843.1 hypothetical protein BCV69DRAFT_270565 [Pseudomicrostroma glucosiphilum]
MELAAFQDLQRKGMVVPTASFGGHSLGEYSALASVAKCLSVCDLVDTVFYRGLVMGRAVKRDSLGRSNYGMMACSPARVGLSDPHLQEIVNAIEAESGKLLQIVNWNVATTQLVLAGELIALHTLTQTLNWLKVKKIDVKALSQTMDEAQLREHLSEIVKGHYEAALEDEKAKGGRIELARGFCTIPLPGIDVPFHSRYLMGGVGPFRNYLSKKLNWRDIKPSTLIGRYIPNLIAQPFRTDKDWVELVYNSSNSVRLGRVLRDWEKDAWGAPENLQRLTTTLVVELLAYQFASPVRWIETQDVFFSEPYNIDRLVEFGPSPTLKGMAERTHNLKYAAADQARGKRRVFLSSSKDKEAIYYAFADEEEAEAAPAGSESAPAAPAAASAPAPVAAPVAAPAPSSGGGAAQDVPDEPLKATDTVRAILAQKLKKPISEIPLSKAIKDMTGGKSTLSNELVGDLQLEFPAGLPDRGEELPLEELGAALNNAYSGTLGKHTSGLVTKLVNAKMPGGFNLTSVKSHLQKGWGLGPGRTDGVLLVAITQEPAKRLGSEAEAKTFLDAAVSSYAAQTGISLSQGGGSSGGGGGGGGATISSEELEKIEGRHNNHALRQIEVLERFLGSDRRADGRRVDAVSAELQALTDKLDLIKLEHGDTYLDGILPKFSAAKARNFSSSWNWSRQDAMLMYYDIVYGRLQSVDREISARCLSIFGRVDGPALLELMQYTINRVDPSMGPTYELAKEFGQQLIENCKEFMNMPPRFKEVFACTAPKTEIDGKGNIVFREVKREGVRKAMEGFVKEQSQGTRTSGYQVDLALAAENAKRLYSLVRNEPAVSKLNKSTVKGLYNEVARALGQPRQTQRISNPRSGTRRGSSNLQRPVALDAAPSNDARQPLLSIKRQVGGAWQTSQKLTSVYFSVLEDFASEGMSFEGRNVLITGAGRGSIAVEVLKGLLAGGARCVVTTSSYSRKTVEFYQSIYQKLGARGSTLTVVPFNAASKSDTEALVDYIYTTLQLDLDVCIPFAAIPEKGMDISELGDKSELAHRALMINVLRLLGVIKATKAKRGITTRPTLCLVPLSPNQGQMGFDGTYSESKLGLTTLANRWGSEGWSDYLSIVGAIIGWTRTGLMDANNIVAEEIEKMGMRTYSCSEMAFSILGLLSPTMFAQATVEPIHADLTGGFASIPNLSEATGKIRKRIQDEAAKRRAIALDSSADFKVVQGAAAEALHQTVKVEPRSHFRFEHVFDKWTMEQHKRIAKLSHELTQQELEQTIVVTGFAEVSPFGSTRSRWQFEAYGTLTIEATIELAWIMGLIKHHSGPLKTGKQYVGWVDSASGEPVEDREMKNKYEQEILAHTGVRLIEPSLFKGYDPKKKGYTQEIELTEDMPTFEASEEEALKFVNEHGDKGVDIWKNEAGSWVVQLKKGARVLVPKSVVFSRTVAGQLPTGWVATRYGIPDELAKNIDRIGLWVIVCAAEALIMSGISDPFELYEHMHPSDVGNAIGSGMGGMQSLQAIFSERKAEKDPAKDVLQESFINVPAAWVNLLLLSAAGPITPTVGACATGLQSITVASDAIKTGKAKVMLAGGVDDFSEEGSMEFSLMQATSNAEEELKAGREPSEMSRPTTTTRSGFMESQGGGVQVLMSAATAIQLGAPIQGIIAHASTHTDKQGRSIPAPGRGVMSAASKLQATLATWGLTADDIGAASIHGTSTKANDKNESHCYHTMLEKMGRTPHNALPISAQKSVLGHSKGGAATWAFNGCLQMLHTSTVAGNRNADDISPELKQYSYLLYPSTSIQRTPEDLNATLLTSFGFGQVGGVILTLHPSHLLARLGESTYNKYKTDRRGRQALTYGRMHSAFTNNDLVRTKSEPPFAPADEDAVLLNTNARAQKVGNSWKFSSSSSQQEASLQASLGGAAGIGIDIEDVASFPAENETFLSRNFTDEEIAYCRGQPNPKASFTGRFAAKEAVFKSLSVASKGSASPMKDIEITATPEGPRVNLTGEAASAAKGAKFLVSISHADVNAVAIAHRLA